MKRWFIRAVILSAAAAVLVSVTWAATGRVQTVSSATVPNDVTPAGKPFEFVDRPVRLLDTRKDAIAGYLTIPASNVCDPTVVVPTAPTVPFTGKIPADSAVCFVTTAVGRGTAGLLLNVTATDSEGPGFVQFVTGNDIVGATSHINKAPGQTVANQVTLKLGVAGGGVYFYILIVNQGAATNLVMDWEGSYFLNPVP